MGKKEKGEIQYEHVIAFMRDNVQSMGLSSGWAWLDDPRRVAFALSRYKFVGKMLNGRKRVLEGGCGDGYFSRIVRQSVESLVAVDFDRDFIDDARTRPCDKWPIEFRTHDFLDGGVEGSFDGIYSLDVFEHIPPAVEDRFMANLIAPLAPHGVVIIGTPSAESQEYASPQSRAGHVNCKSQDDLRRFMGKYFHTVFMFSMNDEVVHTGYSKMSHYNLAVCCERKEADGACR